jgi:tetratricopeptide (TPR) repeat protein
VKDEAANREALDYACRQVEADPTDGLFWLLKGHCHYRLGELEAAAEAYGRAGDLGEEHSHAHFFQATCLLELGRVDEAIPPLRLQLEAIPDHIDALFLLGLCLRQSDLREESDRVLERVRDIDIGYYEEMFANYVEALAKGSEDPYIRQGLKDAAKALRSREE